MDFSLREATAATLQQRQFDGLITALLATVGEPTKVVRLLLGTGEVGDQLIASIRAYVHSRTRRLPGGERVLRANAHGPREYELWLEGPAQQPVVNQLSHIAIKHDGLPQVDNPHLLKPIDELNLSVRAYNGLQNAKVTTVQQLIGQSERSLLKHKNFGKKSIREIKERLTELGLTLAEGQALRSVS
jgi:Bacterial RNA polymerase, alpha chain C terminal domain